MKPLDFDFPLMSEISRRPPYAVDHDELAGEIDTELADRSAFYARMAARAKMSQADADRHIDLLAAIRDDLAFAYTRDAGWLGQRHGWDAKVRELRRELAIRRNTWPKRIANAADPLDLVTAALRMERLEAVHFKYWIELFQFDVDEDLQPADRRSRIRAEHWRRWQWQREQLAAEATARLVPAGFAAWLHKVAAGEPDAFRVWIKFEAEARRLDLAPQEEAAA